MITSEDDDMTLVRSELINQIANDQNNLSSKDIELCVHEIINCMTNSLCHGQRIEIRGFGSFSLRYRPPRHAHNPKTGVKVATIAKYTPHFKPGKDMRERVNNRFLAERALNAPATEDTEVV